ncbi:MAG: peptide chain release factor N(5)-glutamine methyltransferase [Anaerolineaceae bacterium]|nr:peptide chain release factor N(5)-glutamine methyltransferase [Anaerolineaceae bacterium]
MSFSSISDSPGLDAQVLISHALKKSRSWVLSHQDEQLSGIELKQLNDLAKDYLSGLPLPYILGNWEFFGFPFLVSPDVLIPRPETELLVEEALQFIVQDNKIKTVLDIGTGSGCISISIAKHHPNSIIFASDISREALTIAKKNITMNEVSDQVHLIQADLLPPIQIPVDLICANLPYIPTETLKELQVAKHEPLLALDGGSTGLFLIEKLLSAAKHLMAPEYMLLFEIEDRQKEDVSALAKKHYPEAQFLVISDLTGKPRLLKIWKQK